MLRGGRLARWSGPLMLIRLRRQCLVVMGFALLRSGYQRLGRARRRRLLRGILNLGTCVLPRALMVRRWHRLQRSRLSSEPILPGGIIDCRS